MGKTLANGETGELGNETRWHRAGALHWMWTGTTAGFFRTLAAGRRNQYLGVCRKVSPDISEAWRVREPQPHQIVTAPPWSGCYVTSPRPRCSDLDLYDPERPPAHETVATPERTMDEDTIVGFRWPSYTVSVTPQRVTGEKKWRGRHAWCDAKMDAETAVRIDSGRLCSFLPCRSRKPVVHSVDAKRGCVARGRTDGQLHVYGGGGGGGDGRGQGKPVHSRVRP
ncbi:hypothetical protein LZ31DRAFT_163843 [Colletotrichum somersetense]|nr:hypothetical protein LZ31DRAFT_163843 [Colletotrichum somersetense]